MRIGEVAAAAGVSTRALRYYEEQGLLGSDRSPGGQRHYDSTAVDQVRWLQALYGAGLPSRTIRELLPCMHDGVLTPAMLRRLVAERDRVAAQVEELTGVRDRLDDLVRRSSEHVARGDVREHDGTGGGPAAVAACLASSDGGTRSR